MTKTQSTPAQKYIEPTEPQTTVRTVSIPPEIVFIVCFGCMLLAILGALFGAFK